MPETTRAFVAIPIPSTVAASLERLQGRLKPRLSSAKWVSAECLHLTIAFLGDVPTDRIDSIVRAVAETAKGFPPLALELRGLGAFPNPKSAGILWIGAVGPDMGRLGSLHQATSRSLSQIDIPLADDRFNAHVTLARLKRGRGTDATRVIAEFADWSAGALVASEIIIYRSILGGDGPTYDELGRGPFEASGSSNSTEPARPVIMPREGTHNESNGTGASHAGSRRP